MSESIGFRDANREFDEVIIGAGAAGLAAAQRLAVADRSVVIVEARDRVGGRIHTLRPSGWPLPVEAGAEYIHGPADVIWNAVRAANLLTCQVSDRQWQAAAGRVQPHDFEPLWRRIFNRLEDLAQDELSFADFLSRHCSDLTPAERDQATAYVEGFNAADSRIVSARWLLEADRASGQGGEAGAWRVHGGYDGILNGHLAVIRRMGVQLRLSTVVSTIRWQPGKVEVLVRSRLGLPLPPIHASRAIITLPLGVLRLPADSEGAVQFLPDLPEKWSACGTLHMGPVVKLALRFREPIWEDLNRARVGFLHTPEGTFPTWWTTNPWRTTMLTGWAAGPAAERLAGSNSDALVATAIQSLACALGREPLSMAAQLEAWHLTDWQADPYSRGAYSYVGTGGRSAPRRLAEAVGDTLFFAGEATHETLNGTVAGALASGERAAEEVLKVS